MHISAKCSIALHCLLLISEYQSRVKVTSEILASSTGCNAVTIRNLTGLLKQANLITIARGVGGARLARAPEEITVWDVYSALDADRHTQMIAMHPNPSLQCPVGRRIKPVREQTYRQVEDAVCESMSRITLAQIQANYQLARQLEKENLKKSSR